MEDITASSASKILHINRNTTNAYYNEIREKILQYSLKEQAKELGEFELDESYFGARRVHGKRGRGAAGKMPVFGLLKRNGKVFVTVVPHCLKEEPVPFIQEKIPAGSTPAGWPECLRRPHSQRLQALTAEFSIMRMNLCAGNPTSTALNASGVTPNDASQSSMV